MSVEQNELLLCVIYILILKYTTKLKYWPAVFIYLKAYENELDATLWFQFCVPEAFDVRKQIPLPWFSCSLREWTQTLSASLVQL